jgi:predicted dehydrogenase
VHLNRFNQRRRVALVGCGLWGKNMLRDLQTLGCAVLVADLSADARAYAEAAGADAVVASIQELPSVDAGFVATPTQAHATCIEALLDRGIPVFTEKPLCDDVERARVLARRAPESLFELHKWRYHPAIEEMGRIVRSGELGPAVGLHTARLGCGNPHHDVDSAWILLPHDLTIGLEVLGAMPEPRAAVADVTGGFAQGLTAILGGTPWHTIEVSTRYPGKRREMRLYCRDGVAVLGDSYDDHLAITRFADPHSLIVPEPEIRPVSTEPPLLRELRTCVEFLDGGPAPRSSAAEAVRVVEMITTLRQLAGLDVVASVA